MLACCEVETVADAVAAGVDVLGTAGTDEAGTDVVSDTSGFELPDTD